jgi:hypothetical protein
MVFGVGSLFEERDVSIYLVAWKAAVKFSGLVISMCRHIWLFQDSNFRYLRALKVGSWDIAANKKICIFKSGPTSELDEAYIVMGRGFSFTTILWENQVRPFRKHPIEKSLLHRQVSREGLMAMMVSSRMVSIKCLHLRNVLKRSSKVYGFAKNLYQSSARIIAIILDLVATHRYWGTGKCKLAPNQFPSSRPHFRSSTRNVSSAIMGLTYWSI